MPIEALLESSVERPILTQRRMVASVLLVDSNLASRLTLKSVLGKAGYQVEGAATTAEAVSRLVTGRYQLVLADLRNESDDAGPALLAYARQMDYRPATALINLDMREPDSGPARTARVERVVRVSNEDISNLLVYVAEMISRRADLRMYRASLC